MLSNLLSGNLGFIEAIVYILSSLAVIFLTLPVHEFAHGFVAEKLGDKTPRWQGRITLNPFAHIDWIGAACILLFGFGWAKPVQVNMNGFKNPKRDMAIVALAGPASNIIVAFLCLLATNLLSLIPFIPALNTVIYFIYYFFFFIAEINIYLAVFNLIPVPPLDGSRLLTALLPYKYYNLLMHYERYIYIGLLALIWFGVLDVPLSFLSNAVFKGVSTVANLPFMFFK